jgi:hypothetical protein
MIKPQLPHNPTYNGVRPICKGVVSQSCQCLVLSSTSPCKKLTNLSLNIDIRSTNGPTDSMINLQKKKHTTKKLARDKCVSPPNKKN